MTERNAPNEPALIKGPTLAWARPWLATFALVGVVAAARFVYLAFFSPFTLIEDEAHYWEWARRLGWSYYSKGPGVAWTIAASTALFGDTELGVRFPAIVASSVSALVVAGLARRVFRDGRVGFFAAAMLMTMPAHQASSMLMTIDGPYMALWAIACWAAWEAFTRERGRLIWWAVFGAAIGVGFLYKYTILILPVGVVAFAVFFRKSIRGPGVSGVLIALATAALGLIPVTIWNAQHDWATVRHLLGHVGLPGGDTAPKGDGRAYDPLWTLEFLGLQLAAAGPALVLTILGLINVARSRRGRDRPPPTWAPAGVAFLLCTAAPIFLMYLGVTFFTNVEANWTVAGFLTLAPIAGWAAVDGQDRRDRPLRALREASIITFGLLSTAIVVAGVLASGPLRRDIPGLTRTTGARELAAQTQELADGLEGEPIFMAVHYGRASLMAFYLDGNPTVYAAQSLLGGRKTQYDLWPETDLRNAETVATLRGRPAVLLGADRALWELAFDGVVEHGKLPAEPKADRLTFTAERFLGFPTASEPDDANNP